MEQRIPGFIENLQVHEPLTAGPLAVYPVFNQRTAGQPYVLLAEALAQNMVNVEEKGGGTVPTLVVINKSETMILVTQGDELVGGKQNRIVNSSFLVAPMSVVDVPVSCVEQGRWRHVSARFAHGEKAFYKLRHAVNQRVTDSLRARRGHTADQQEVWSAVGQEIRAAAAESPTGAMQDAYRARRTSMNELEQRLQYVDGASGLVCAVRGRIAFAEIFDRPAPCRNAWPRLVRTLAFETGAEDVRHLEPGAVAAFIELAKDTQANPFPAAGLGIDIRLSSKRVSGSVLCLDESVVHCSLFAEPDA